MPVVESNYVIIKVARGHAMLEEPRFSKIRILIEDLANETVKVKITEASVDDVKESLVRAFTRIMQSDTRSDHTNELTTAKAAEFLNVSRPFVCKLIDSGALRARKVGKHRRIQKSELESYKVKMFDVASRACRDVANLAFNENAEHNYGSSAESASSD